MADEIELQDAGDYEIVPLGPLRRLEKRIEKMETSNTLSHDETLMRDMLDLMKANQKLVNDVVESNTVLRSSVSQLTDKMDSVVENMNNFMSLLREATETSLEEDVSQEIGSNIVQPISDRLGEVSTGIKEMLDGMKETNSQLLEGLSKLDNRLKRMYATQRRTEFFPGQRTSQTQRMPTVTGQQT